MVGAAFGLYISTENKSVVSWYRYVQYLTSAAARGAALL